MARWHSCNVLDFGAAVRRVWQFDGSSFDLNREQASRNGEPLPENLVGKSWSSLWQKKLNVAWLPPENVFIRVAQFPQSTPEETRAMVELQLEKLSPIPVMQAVWSMQILPHASGNMQTIVVIIVTRNVVEEFLGRLEGQGYLTDRLELPLLDQLQATAIREEGAWIYPETQSGRHTALVAWWYGGVLQNIDLLTLPAAANRAAGLKDQLMQMAWAGELEGWLTSPPRWHLVADEATAAEWVKPLQDGLEQSIEIVAPLSGTELAARTARRAAQAGPGNSLLPPEFAARYKRQLVDRLWMRALGAGLAIYVMVLIAYFAALTVFNYKTTAAETLIRGQDLTYTNALQLNAQLKVLKDRQELKFAALDCWESLAETLPANITLDSMNFSDGKRLSLSGTAPADQSIAISDWSDTLRKHIVRGQPLFDPNKSDPPRIQVMPGGVRWSYDLELKRWDEKDER